MSGTAVTGMPVSGTEQVLADWLIAFAVVLVALTATVTVLTRDPARQAVMLGVLGLHLALLFALLQAPDVALSQLAVGTVVTPLLFLLTVRTIRRSPGGGPGKDSKSGEDGRRGEVRRR
ncbi:Na(+)/H(+) antiporter subunit B [Streptomyces sp. NPDC001514]